MATERILGVGIIGCGEATQALHIPALMSLAARFRIAACADAVPALAERIAASVGARVLTTEKLLLDPAVDVVLIASSHASHADLAVAACEAKRAAVLLEKPPATTSAEVRRIALASERTGVPVLCAYPHVFDPAVAHARRALKGQAQSGEFWCRIGPNSRYTGHLLDTIRMASSNEAARSFEQARRQAAAAALGPGLTDFQVLAHAWIVGLSIHDMPVLRRVMGEPEQLLHASARELSEGRLGYDAMLGFAGGRRAILMVELLDHQQTDWGFAVRGTGRTVAVRYPTTYAVTAPSTCTIVEEVDGMTVETCAGGRYESGFRREWLHLHDVVVRGAVPETPIADAVNDLLILEDIARVVCGRPRQHHRHSGESHAGTSSAQPRLHLATGSS